MTEESIYSQLSAKFGDACLAFENEASHNPGALIDSTKLMDIMIELKENPAFAFDSLMCVSGFDLGEEAELGMIYHLYSVSLNHYFTIKTLLNRTTPKVASVANMWRTADWHEREVYDMFGVIFEGHPDFKRILLEEDWEGYPLRKDYVPAEFYRGMKIAKER
jgi:NADH-quinone oxidoreductase subunit C